jgi:monoterpene epsilon-lactone hydrolase
VTAPRVPSDLMRFGAWLLGRRCLNPSLPWPVQRARLDRLTAPALLPRGVAVTRESVAGLPAVVVSAATPGPTVLHFHGGGYCVGSARTPLVWAAHLAAKTGCRVILPEYRLAPEHPFPAAFEDADTILAEVCGEAGAASVVVSGDSAGGGLALAVLMARRDAGREPLAGGILLSPWLDLTRDRRAIPALVRLDVLLSPGWLEACAHAYAGETDLGDVRVSPLRAGPEGLPPLLIQSPARDLLAPDAERMAARAAAAGVDVTYTRWPRLWHDFMLQPGLLAAADSAVAQAGWFLAKVTTLLRLLPVWAEERAELCRVEFGFLERGEVPAARGLGHANHVRGALEPRAGRAKGTAGRGAAWERDVAGEEREAGGNLDAAGVLRGRDRGVRAVHPHRGADRTGQPVDRDVCEDLVLGNGSLIWSCQLPGATAAAARRKPRCGNGHTGAVIAVDSGLVVDLAHSRAPHEHANAKVGVQQARDAA